MESMPKISDDLKLYCDNYIMKCTRYRQRILVLCEGDRENYRRTPQTFSQTKNYPDSSFYRKCIPRRWEGNSRPNFINCGGRSEVINCYSYIYNVGHNHENIDINKLFALIDLDISSEKIENYKFSNTEDIFYNLYNDTETIQENTGDHKIFVLGLRHKESYFIIPELQKLLYDELKIKFSDLYQRIIHEIYQDKGISQNWNLLKLRLQNYCGNIELDNLKEFFENMYNSVDAGTEEDKRKFTFNLLKVINSKQYWREVLELSSDDISNSRDRQQIEYIIAEYYRDYDLTTDLHIPTFFKILHNFIAPD